MRKSGNEQFNSVAFNASFRGKSAHNSHQSLPILSAGQTSKRNRFLEVSKQINKEADFLKVIHQYNYSKKSIGSRASSLNSLHYEDLSGQVHYSKPHKAICKPTNKQKVINQFRGPKTHNKLDRKFKRISKIGLISDRKIKACYSEHEIPVFRIAANMQYDAKLKITHIQNIHKLNFYCPDSVPIVYCIKDPQHNFIARAMQQKSDDLPVCVSLLPESLDPKQGVSKSVRNKYLKDMLTKMRHTFDPEIMSRMPVHHNENQFDMNRYAELMSRFEHSLHPLTIIKLETLITELSLQFVGLPKHLKQQLDSQIVQSFKFGNTAAVTDYFLKSPQNKQRMQKTGPVNQYLLHKNKFNTFLRILYHGSYSKGHYKSWYEYVKGNRAKLIHKFTKIDRKAQILHNWSKNFEDLVLVEESYWHIRKDVVSLSQFFNIQVCRIDLLIALLQEVWGYGAVLILEIDSKSQALQHSSLIDDFFMEIDEMEFWTRQINIQNEEQEAKDYEALLKSHIKNRVPRELLEPEESELGLSSRPKPESRQKKAQEIEHKTLNVQTLLSISYQKIISKSITCYLDCIRNSNKPMFNLSLLIDRQTLRMEQDEEFVLQTLCSIITYIYSKKIKVSSWKKNQGGVPNSTVRYKVYDKIKEEGVDERQPAWNFIIEYRYQHVLEKSIHSWLNFVKQSYQKSQLVYHRFSNFMPFVKLTAKEKVLMQESECIETDQWLRDKQLFNKNMSCLKDYKEELRRIPTQVDVGIFRVNCQHPVKILSQRISDLEYILEQKYLSKVYKKIHELEKDVAKVMFVSHSNNITINNIEQVIQNYDQYILSLQRMRVSMRSLASQVYFFVERQPKSATLISRYQQLIHKRDELLACIQQMKQQAYHDAQILQQQVEQQNRHTSLHLQELSNNFALLINEYFDFSKLDSYIRKIEDFQTQINDFTPKLNRQNSDDWHLYQQVTQKTKVHYEFWQAVSGFYATIRHLHHRAVSELDAQNYTTLINQCNRNKNEFLCQFSSSQYSQQATIIEKFKRDLAKYESITPFIRILATDIIPKEYFGLFNCQIFNQINFRRLLNVSNLDSYYPAISELGLRAKCEHEIFTQFQSILTQMKTIKIIVVDFNGNDSLHVTKTQQLIVQMSDYSFRCEDLLTKNYCEKYRNQISDLKFNLQQCCIIIEKWLSVQKQYFKLAEFYHSNENYENQTDFNAIKCVYQKMMKSLDLDNSVQHLPMNRYLIEALERIQAIVSRLKTCLYANFSAIKASYPRLYLLNDEQILSLMNNVNNVSKYLMKCLPSINTIIVKDDAIERVGGFSTTPRKDTQNKPGQLTGNYLILPEPIQIKDKLSQTAIWLQKLLTQITSKLKNDLLSEDPTNQQIQILQQQLLFTKLIEQILNKTSEQTKKFKSLQRSLLTKIDNIKKSNSHLYYKQNIILLHVINRQTVHSLIGFENLNRNSYEWLRKPRFYRNDDNRVNVTVSTIYKDYEYGFKFIEECSVIVSEVGLFGNLLLGARESGKKQLLRNYSRMTGNQLFVYEQGLTSSSEIENIVNYFKMSVHGGGWLVIPEIGQMHESVIRVMTQCFDCVRQAIESSSKNVTFFDYKPLRLMAGCQLFLTALKSTSLHCWSLYFRSMWVPKPNKEFLFNLYSQASFLNDENSLAKSSSKKLGVQFMFKILDFFCFSSSGRSVPTAFIKSIINAEGNKTQFREVVPEKLLNASIKAGIIEEESITGTPIDNQHIYTILHHSPFIVLYLRQTNQQTFISSYFNPNNSLHYHKTLPTSQQLQCLLQYAHMKSRQTNNKYYLLINNGLKLHKFINQITRILQPNKIDLTVVYIEPYERMHYDVAMRLKYDIQAISIPQLRTMQNWQKQQKLGVNTDKKCSEMNSQFVKLLSQFISQYLQYNVNQAELYSTFRSFVWLWGRIVANGHSHKSTFVFCISWICNTSDEMEMLIARFLRENELLSSDKLNRLKSQRLEQNGESSCMINFCRRPLTIYNSILTNLRFVRQSATKVPLILQNTCNLIEIPDSLALGEDCLHLYPPELRTCAQAHKRIFLKQNHRKTQQSRQIYVHSAQKLSQEVIEFLLQLADHQQALFFHKSQLNRLKQSQFYFIFDFSTKIPQKLSKISHKVHIKFNSHETTEINNCKYYQFLSNNSGTLFFSTGLIKAHSQIETEFIKRYSKQLSYNALLTKLYTHQTDDLDQILAELLTFISVSIPNCSHSFQQILFNLCFYPNEIHEQVSNAQNSVIKIRDNHQLQIRKQICRGLLQLNEFEYLNQYLYNNLLTLHQCLSFGHCVIFSQKYGQTQYCIELICKIMSIKIYTIEQFDQNQPFLPNQQKGMLIISQQQMTASTLDSIEHILHRLNQKNYYKSEIIIVLNLSGQPKNHQLTAILNNTFTHSHLQPLQTDNIKNIINLQETLKMLDNNKNEIVLCVDSSWLQNGRSFNSGDRLIEYFMSFHHKNNWFVMQFVETLKKVEEKEHRKYLFYKGITEQLFEILAQLGNKATNMPARIAAIESILVKSNTKIHQFQAQIAIQSEQKQKIITTINRIKQKINQLTTQNIQKQQVAARIRKTSDDTMGRIYNKLDCLSTLEVSKIKSKRDNDSSGCIYNLLVILLGGNPQKSKVLNSDRLKEVLRDDYENGNKNGENFRKIAGEIRTEGRKKLEKMGTVWKLLGQWVIAVEEIELKSIQELKSIEQSVHQTKQCINNLTLQLEQLSVIMEEKSGYLSGLITAYQKIKSDKTEQQSDLKTLLNKQQKLHHILNLLNQKQYSLNISKNLAQWMFFAPETILLETLNLLSLNQHETQTLIIQQLAQNAQIKHKINKKQEIVKLTTSLCDNIFEGYDELLSFSHEDEIYGVEHLKLISMILSERKCVQIIEDQSEIVAWKIKSLLRAQEHFCVIELDTDSVTQLIDLLERNRSTYTRFFVTGYGFRSVEQQNKLDCYLYNLTHKTRDIQIIMVFRFINLLTQCCMSRFISRRRFKPTFAMLLNIVGRNMMGSAYQSSFTQFPSKVKQSKLMKSLFEGVEKFERSDCQNNEELINVLGQLQEVDEICRRQKAKFRECSDNLHSLTHIVAQYFTLLTILMDMERNYPICLFENGKCYKTFIECICGRNFRNAQSCTHQEQFHYFIVKLTYSINFINADTLIYVCMLSLFVMEKPSNICHYQICDLLLQVSTLKSEQQRIKVIYESLLTQQISYEKIAQLSQLGCYSSVCPPWLECLIYLLSGSHMKYAGSFLLTMKQSKYCQVIEEIKTRDKCKNKHYYQRVNKMGSPGYLMPEKQVWLVKTIAAHPEQCIEYLKARTKLELKNETKLIPFYYNPSDWEVFLEKLSATSKIAHLVLVNSYELEVEQIDLIINSLIRSNKPQSLRIYVITQQKTLVNHREYVEYMQYRGNHEQTIDFEVMTTNLMQTIEKRECSHIEARNDNMEVIKLLPNLMKQCLNYVELRQHLGNIYSTLVECLCRTEMMSSTGNCHKFLNDYFWKFDIKLNSHEILDDAVLDRVPNRKNSHSANLQQSQQILKQLKNSNTLTNQHRDLLKNWLQHHIELILNSKQQYSTIDMDFICELVRYNRATITRAQTLKLIVYRSVLGSIYCLNNSPTYKTIISLQISLKCITKHQIVSLTLQELQPLFMDYGGQELQFEIMVIENQDCSQLIQESQIESILKYYTMEVSLPAVGESIMSILYMRAK